MVSFRSEHSLSVYLGIFVPFQYIFSGALVSTQDMPSWWAVRLIVQLF